MTDGLIDLSGIWSVLGGVFAGWGGYLAIILGVYIGLFFVGLVLEATRRKRGGV